MLSVKKVFEGKEGQQLVIKENDKVLRSGAFCGLETSDFHVKVFIGNSFYEMPFPLKTEECTGGYVFDYRADVLHLNDSTLQDINGLLAERKTKNKFFGKKITLLFQQPLP